jgi:hypothetical protein
VSRCFGDPAIQTGSFPAAGGQYTNPDDPTFDRGWCDQDRTHLASFTVSAQTPRFEARALRFWASDWRISGLVSARSGAPINVTGPDRAGTGIRNQRVDQVLDNPYGDRTACAREAPDRAWQACAAALNNWLNADAFALPAPGTLGNFRRNSVRGPAFRAVDVALSRLVSVGAGRRVELRVEAFNVFNTFNKDLPEMNRSVATFGQITSMAGTPRIMQFGVRYTF